MGKTRSSPALVQPTTRPLTHFGDSYSDSPINPTGHTDTTRVDLIYNKTTLVTIVTSHKGLMVTNGFH